MRLMGRLSVPVFLAAVFFAAPFAVRAQNVSSANYQVLAPVVTSGGGYANSSSYSVLGVISEFTHGAASSLSFGSNPGFAAFPFVSTPVVSATGGDASASLSWTAATGVLGYSVSGYAVGQSGVSGGPYAFTSVGNVLSYAASGLTNGTPYYFVLRVLDPQGITIATSTEVSATPVAPPPPPPPTSPSTSGGGGSFGGGGSVTVSGGATVNFSGRAYPNSIITLLQDARIVVSTEADANALFQISLGNIAPGSYVFSIYGQDSVGNRSAIQSFPITLTAGAETSIGGIFISPTIDVDKSQVKRGDNLTIFGQSTPKSNVVIAVNSSVELFLQTKSDAIGAYLYTLDTSPLEYGSHSTKSKAATAGQISDFGSAVGFAVGDRTILKKATPACGLIGDLNCDNRVNLIDFSIMAYWYRRPLSGTGLKADLNHDGKVDLVDFSILASHWTG